MFSQSNSREVQRPAQCFSTNLALRQRILVVEDDLLIRRLNREMLIFSGYGVDTAEDGADAWDKLQMNHYDLLVTDNDMPKLSGVGLLKKVHAAGLALPVIMATGKFPSKEYACQPWLQPAVTLLKPYTFNELVGAVQIVLLAITGAGADTAQATCVGAQAATTDSTWSSNGKHFIPLHIG